MDIHFRMADPPPRPILPEVASEDSTSSSNFATSTTRQHGCSKTAVPMAYAVSADHIVTSRRVDNKRACIAISFPHATSTSSFHNFAPPIGATEHTTIWESI